MSFDNVYNDRERAAAYARLEFPGTYYLAYRDLPEIITKYTHGNTVLDFGCGTGRSTRFLQKLGFAVTGVDISPDMVKQARVGDPEGDYRVIADGDFCEFTSGTYDLILSVFTFDNIPTMERKVSLFAGLADLLKDSGTIINVVSAPEIYTHEWASFTTRDFPENNRAKSGDTVRIIMTDVPDRRPVEDITWSDEDYCEVFTRAGLQILETYRPLARKDEPYEWVNELTIPPWTIYVLGKSS